MISPGKSILLVACAAGLILQGSRSLSAGDGDDHHGRSARLTAPEGSNARGVVVLGSDSLTVKIGGLAAGDYSVLLDDGTGTKAEVGKITVVAEDANDDDEAEGDANDGEEGDGGHEEGDHEDARGSLVLSAPNLPFGAASPADLAGRAICVTDKDGNVVLSGTTPKAIVEEPERRNARCDLARPDPAVDEDAEGQIKIESGAGRIVIKVHLENLEPGKVYEVLLTNPADGKSESLGKVTVNDEGEGHLKVDSEKGDAIPFGAGTLDALKGFGVSVNDPDGKTVLAGEVCAAAPAHDDEGDDGDDGDDDEHDGEHHHGDHCEADLSLPDPAVDADASGEVESSAQKLEVEVKGLAADATYDVVLTNPADATTQTVGQIKTDGEGKGELEVVAAEGATLAFGGFGVAVVDAAGATVLVGAVPAGDCNDEEHEGDDGEDHEGREGGGGGIAVGPAPDEPFFLMTKPFDETFLRGDTNRDGGVDISDAVATLLYLFSGGARPYCLDAADTNDDGALDITDPISLLSYLFTGGKSPASPGPLIPGSDSTADGLYCEEPGA